MPLDISALKQAFENVGSPKKDPNENVDSPENDPKTLSSRLSEVKDDASLNEFYDYWKKFFKNRVGKLHPDKGGDDNQFKEFNQNAERIIKYFDEYTQASGAGRKFKDDEAKNDFLNIARQMESKNNHQPDGKNSSYRDFHNDQDYVFSSTRPQQKPQEKPIYESAKTDFSTSTKEAMEFIEVLRGFFKDQRTKNEEFSNQNKNSDFPKNEYNPSNFFDNIQPEDKLTSTFVKWHDPNGRSAFAIEFKILNKEDPSRSSNFSYKYTDNISLDEFKNISKSHINTNDIANKEGLKFTSFSKLVKYELGVNGRS